MTGGWIKLHRKIIDSWLFKDPEILQIWVAMLCMASHRPRKISFAGRIITLNPGEFSTGRKAFSRAVGVQESKIFRAWNKMKTERIIEQRTDRQCSIISIKNWDTYQQSEQRVNNDRTTSEQRVNTKQEGKNERIKKLRELVSGSDEQPSCHLAVNGHDDSQPKTIIRNQRPKSKIVYRITFDQQSKVFRGIDENDFADWMKIANDGVDIERELNKAALWLAGNKRFKRDYKKFLDSWIGRAK